MGKWTERLRSRNQATPGVADGRPSVGSVSSQTGGILAANEFENSTDTTDKTPFVSSVGTTTDGALAANVPGQGTAKTDGSRADVPAHLAAVAGRVCLWRVPGKSILHMVAGPDHDLREQHPEAVPLFDQAHRDRVRKGELTRGAQPTAEEWKREMRGVLESICCDDDGAICDALCSAEDDPIAALAYYRQLAAKVAA